MEKNEAKKRIIEKMKKRRESKSNIKDLFIDEIHRKRYEEVLEKDNTHNDDLERKGLFYILTGNKDLYSKIDNIYNFKEHGFKISCFEKVDFTSSIRKLLKLGYHMYNNNNECPTIIDLFGYLDEENKILAINSIKIRFNM